MPQPFFCPFFIAAFRESRCGPSLPGLCLTQRSLTRGFPRLLVFSRKKRSREGGEATRRQILGTAVRLFAEHGYADTTSKMICREAGVNIAAVNYYFGSRDDLYRAVLDDVHEHIVNERQMELITSAELPVEEKLERVLDAYIAAA